MKIGIPLPCRKPLLRRSQMVPDPHAPGIFLQRPETFRIKHRRIDVLRILDKGKARLAGHLSRRTASAPQQLVRRDAENPRQRYDHGEVRLRGSRFTNIRTPILFSVKFVFFRRSSRRSGNRCPRPELSCRSRPFRLHGLRSFRSGHSAEARRVCPGPRIV